MTVLNSPRSDSRIAGSELNLPEKIFTASPDFRQNFNRRAFPFTHNLADHPLFEIPRLVELSKMLWSTGEGRVIFQGGDTRVDRRWDQAPRKALSVMNAIARIEESGSWVLLRSVQKDPAYQRLLDKSMAELADLTGVPLQRETSCVDAYIFIASPHCVTPYHIDHESNFLLQIHGQKEDNLFDGGDRSILTDEEIENHYVDSLHGAQYREVNQSKANVFPLVPGTGVHHPVRWPHWVRNGPTYSVSLSVLFFLKDYDRQAHVYQFNHLLRSLKMNPTPPGHSAWRDGLKAFTVGRFGKGEKAANKDEMLRYGIRRLESSVQTAGSFLNRFRKRPTVA